MGTRYAEVPDEPSLPVTVHEVEMWPAQFLFSKTRTEFWPQGFMLRAGLSENHFM